MHQARVFAFVLSMALASGAGADVRHETVEKATPLARNLFDAVSLDQFEKATFTSSRGTSLPYRVLRPSRPQPGKTYPLVIQLHGSGGIGSDNAGQLERLAKAWAMPELRERYQAFILVPQFADRSASYGSAAPDQHAEAAPALSDALELIHAFAAQAPVDRSRIYATGFSMGGSAAWLLPCLAPELFAGIVPISGIAPPDDQAPKFTHLPVLAMHGNADPENPITADRRFIRALAEQDAQHVSWREYAGLDHQPPADIYPGLWWRDWLFAQRRH